MPAAQVQASAGGAGPPSPTIPEWLYLCFGLCLPPPPPPEPKELKKEAPKKGPSEDWRKIPVVAEHDLLKQLGKGGFSEIWLAEHRSSHELVAIKVVQLVDAELEPDEVATLLSEAKYLRTLDCPYLLQCRDAVHTGQHLVLVLEYLSGGELLEQIHKVKKYTEAEAAKLFAQAVSAVSYMHNLNLLHRDIKPENIMFERPVEVCQAEGRPFRVKLIDLGMAALYDENKPIIGTVGTPGFVAPELWNDKPHTYACDIYSLGVVLFVMLTGRKPHSGADIRMMTYCNKSIHDAPGLKDERFLALSTTARSLLLSMLADDPADRPTAAAVLRHPFITADDSNAEAQREMGDVVRRRMIELAQLRRVHGLRYALHVGQGLWGGKAADKVALLEELDRRRRLLRGWDSAGEHHQHLPSDLVHAAVSGLKSECRSSDLNRNSLAVSFATPPALMALRGANTHTHVNGPIHVAPLHHHQMSRLGAQTAEPSRSVFPAPGGPASANGSVAATATATATCTAANSTSASGTATPIPGDSVHGDSAAARRPSTSCNGYAAPGSRGSSGGRGSASPFAPSAQLPTPPDGTLGASSCTDGSAPEPHSQEVVQQGASVDQQHTAGRLTPAAPASTPCASHPHTRPGSHNPSRHHSRNPSHGSVAPGALPGSGLAPSTMGHHASGACETAAAAAARAAAMDPMSLVNGMVHRSNTMPGSGLEAAMAEEGATPVATEEEHVQALLTKCMSVNDFDLELLYHRKSIERMLAAVVAGGVGEAAAGAHAAEGHHPQQPHTVQP